MSTTPTDTPATVDSLIAEHVAKLQAIYDSRTAGDHTFTGALTAFAWALTPLLARQWIATSDIPEEAVTAGVERFADWLAASDVGIGEFERHMGPSADEVVRSVLTAALPIVLSARDEQTADDRPVCPCVTDDTYHDEPSTPTWTSHGWWIGDGPEPTEGRPSEGARCGGPGRCKTCKAEAATHRTDTTNALLAEQCELDQWRAGVRRQSADRDTETVAPADEFAGFYITNDDGYPALSFYPREDEDGELVRFADAGTSLDELVKAAREHRAASLRGEE